MQIRSFVACLVVAVASLSSGFAEDRPNILWISCEDISPNLGCYGDGYAKTPTLDRLAADGVRFDRAFTHAGVCAVLRSGVITGMYPVSIGSQHMRSHIVPPANVHCFSERLRRAGYFCTNRSKTDYQFPPPASAWDRQGGAHQDWRERPEGAPFFSVINITVTHESQIRHSDKRHAQVLKAIGELKHSPKEAAAFLPEYLPDTPEARRDWAWYADNISLLDGMVAEILQRLDEDGLTDNTLVVFWGDHGAGMPRGKRWIYDSGTRVPLLMRWPGRLEPGSVREDLTTLLDLAPTMLRVAGVQPPDYMVGRALIGEHAGQEPDLLFFHRDRMDEAYELMRSARDRRFRYIRNFEPEKRYSQGIDYMDKMPSMQAWRRLHAEGKLNAAQSIWFSKHKPIEELYDTQADPWEVHNLAGAPEHQQRLVRMRAAVERWQDDVHDTGLIPEAVLMEQMHREHPDRTTARPNFRLAGSPQRLEIACETPGASIVFRHPDDPSRQWRLYVEPIEPPSNGQLRVKCCRIGYKDSPVATWSSKE